MKTAVAVWQEASEIGVPECDTCPHARRRKEPYPDAGLTGYMHSPGDREVLVCTLTEARAQECDAWLRYSERYQAAKVRAATYLDHVVDVEDPTLVRLLGAIYRDEPDAALELREWLAGAVDEYAEELS